MHIRFTSSLSIALLAFVTLGACGDSTCERYLQLAPVYECLDPETWRGWQAAGCPSDEVLASRPGGLRSLRECVELMESQCDPALAPSCSCLEEPSCSCAIPVGDLRLACAPDVRE
jgi:hypothetical protein